MRTLHLVESPTTPSPLIERAVELDALRAAIRGGGGVVVLEAAAGLGKTALLEQAAALAGEAGWHVRHAAPGPLEHHFPFGVVRALLEAPAREHPELLDGAAAAAGSLLLEGHSPRGDSSMMLIAHSMLWLCSGLAAHKPLALVVDDAQWADRMSLGVLAYLARRIEDLPLLILVGARASSDLLSLLGGVRSATVLHPRPLSARGAADLIRRLAPETPGTVCRDHHRSADGNPWLLTELARQQSGGGQVSAVARGVVRRRLAELTRRDRGVVEALAVIGDQAPPHVVAAIAGITVSELGPARDALVAAGLLAGGGERFAHELIAVAISSDLVRTERERLHREAARALMGAGADPRRVASHLLECSPHADPEVTEWLCVAASGAPPRVAAAYLERALAEHAPGDDRGALLAALGVASFDAGLSEARGRLLAASEAVRSVDVLTRLAAYGVVVDDPVAALDAFIDQPDEHARRVAALDAFDPVVMAHRAWAALLRSDPEACALALAALADGTLVAEANRRRAYELCARVLVVTGHASAEDVIVRLREAASEHESARMRATASLLAAEHALRCGRIAEAETHARMTLDFPEPFTGDALAVLVCALAERGAFQAAHDVLRDRARERAADATSPASAASPDGSPPPATRAEAVLQDARARLSLAEGEYERALEQVGDGLTAALALAHLGRRAEAAELAEAELAVAERFGVRARVAAALHARAVAEPDPAERVVLCERGLAACSSGLEGVRLRLELGAALAYIGRRVEARDALRPALADADAAGAVLLSRRARRELVATGLRPRQAALEGTAALTPRQRQICELAAVGKGNRAIAQELFLSIKTVETHLAAGYRKLGVNTRAELAAELAA